MREIIIIGCGGVGSWVCEYLTRNAEKNGITHMTLIDDDVVEHKNLLRQNFYPNSVGYPKSDTLAYRMNTLAERKLKAIAVKKKILKPRDLMEYNPESECVIATDSLESKKLISKYFHRYLICNCDKNFAEVKNHLDETDTKAWTFRDGYDSEQDLTSNLSTANMVQSIMNQGPIPTPQEQKIHETRKPDVKLVEVTGGGEW